MVEMAQIQYLDLLVLLVVVAAENLVLLDLLADQVVELVVVDPVQPLEHLYKELKVAAQEVELQLRQIVEAVAVAHTIWVVTALEAV
jgi:hypothetical protein